MTKERDKVAAKYPEGDEANEAKLVKLKEENSKSKAKAKEDKKEPTKLINLEDFDINQEIPKLMKAQDVCYSCAFWFCSPFPSPMRNALSILEMAPFYVISADKTGRGFPLLETISYHLKRRLRPPFFCTGKDGGSPLC